MNACALTLAIALGCVGGDTLPSPPPADAWIAEDKLQHFALSFAAVQMGYGVARGALDRRTAVPVAAGAGLLLGVAKEVRDQRTGGRFSLMDLVWDAAGVALAVAFVRQIE